MDRKLISEVKVIAWFAVAQFAAMFIGYAIGADRIIGVPFFLLAGGIASYRLGKATRERV